MANIVKRKSVGKTRKKVGRPRKVGRPKKSSSKKLFGLGMTEKNKKTMKAIFIVGALGIGGYLVYDMFFKKPSGDTTGGGNGDTTGGGSGNNTGGATCSEYDSSLNAEATKMVENYKNWILNTPDVKAQIEPFRQNGKFTEEQGAKRLGVWLLVNQDKKLTESQGNYYLCSNKLW